MSFTPSRLDPAEIRRLLDLRESEHRTFQELARRSDIPVHVLNYRPRQNHRASRPASPGSSASIEGVTTSAAAAIALPRRLPRVEPRRRQVWPRARRSRALLGAHRARLPPGRAQAPPRSGRDGRPDRVVAVHERSFEEEDKVLDPLHVLPLLHRKHRAVPEATALQGWQLPPVIHALRQALRQETRKPDQEWVRVLLLLREHPMSAVAAAAEEALRLGSTLMRWSRCCYATSGALPSTPLSRS